MSSTQFSLQTIIKKLGYDHSADLYYYNDISTINKLPFHTIKVLKEMKPYAFYCVDNKPFVLFFDEVKDFDNMKELSKKIWNSQIPVIIISDESTIKVYNGSFLNIDNFLIDLLENRKISDCDQYSPFSYWNVTDQCFWENYQVNYSNKKLNELLLENIGYVTKRLIEYKIKSPTKLVLRLIFIRFLIDRGVDIGYGSFSNDVLKSQTELLKVVRNKNSLYSVFAHLKDKFNGNLFDLRDEQDDPNLIQDVLELLYDFLSGNMKMTSGQFSLFSMYDFNIIPVELISNIYEILLGKELQEKDKAFYTPIYLVDYILKESVIPHLYSNRQ